jgi:hypothetical protein
VCQKIETKPELINLSVLLPEQVIAVSKKYPRLDHQFDILEIAKMKNQTS